MSGRLSDVSMGSRERARGHPFYPIMQMCPPPGILAVSHTFCQETRSPRTLIYSKTRIVNHSDAPYYPGLRSLSYTDHGNENCDLCGISDAMGGRDDGVTTERCAYHSTNLGGALEHSQYMSFDMGAPRMTVDPQRQAGRKISLRTRHNFQNGANQGNFGMEKTYRDSHEPFVCLRPAPPPPTTQSRNGIIRMNGRGRLHSEPLTNGISHVNGGLRMNSEPQVANQHSKTNGQHRNNAISLKKDTAFTHGEKEERKPYSATERSQTLMFIRKSYDLKSAGANYSTVVKRQDNLRPCRTPLPTYRKPVMPQPILTNESYGDVVDKSVMLTPETDNATLALDGAPSMMSSIVSKTRLGLHDPSQDVMLEQTQVQMQTQTRHPYDFAREVAPASMARKTKASIGSLQRRLDQLLDEVHGEMGNLDED